MYIITSKITEVTNRKCSAFVPFFTSNSAVFVGVGAKIIFAPRHRVA